MDDPENTGARAVPRKDDEGGDDERSRALGQNRSADETARVDEGGERAPCIDGAREVETMEKEKRRREDDPAGGGEPDGDGAAQARRRRRPPSPSSGDGM